jgi:hypothetical protein
MYLYFYKIIANPKNNINTFLKSTLLGHTTLCALGTDAKRCVYCELNQEAQLSYCILAMSLFKRATYPKSRVRIASKALWASAPAGSGSAAIVSQFLARSVRCVREAQSLCVCVGWGLWEQEITLSFERYL